MTIAVVAFQCILVLTEAYSRITISHATYFIWPDDLWVVSSDHCNWETTCAASKWRCTENSFTSSSVLANHVI